MNEQTQNTDSEHSKLPLRAVEDIDKARVMAEAGSQYETSAMIARAAIRRLVEIDTQEGSFSEAAIDYTNHGPVPDDFEGQLERAVAFEIADVVTQPFDSLKENVANGIDIPKSERLRAIANAHAGLEHYEKRADDEENKAAEQYDDAHSSK